MAFSSYGIAEMVLQEADERFAPLFTPDRERLDILKQYCSVIDKVLDEHDGSTFEVEVDENDMMIHMEFCIDSIEVYNTGKDPFQQLLQRAVSFRIQHGEEDGVLFHLVFQSVWVKA